MAPSHSLDLYFHSVPIWLNVICMNSAATNKFNWVIHSIMTVNRRQWVNVVVGSPTVWPDYRSRVDMSWYYRKECGSISGVNQFHVAESWCSWGITHPKHPTWFFCWPPSVILKKCIIMLLHVHFCNTTVLQGNTLGLCENKDSSIATTCPLPPNLIGGSSTHNRWLQTSLIHWYTCTVVASDTSTSSAASLTGYCLHQKCIKRSHFCNVSFDFSKKLPFRMLTRLLQSLHRRQQPSLTSERSCMTIMHPQTHCFCLARTCLSCKKLTMAGVPPKAIGPSSSKDIFHAFRYLPPVLQKILPPRYLYFCACSEQQISGGS